MNNALTNYLNVKEKDISVAFNEISMALQNNKSLSPILQKFSDNLDLDIKLYNENEESYFFCFSVEFHTCCVCRKSC